MKDMDISKYIVPIFVDSILIGTGVLHNSLLVTAAHVIKFCRQGKCFDFLFRQNRYTLGWENNLFFEYDEEKMGVYRDLAIFRTTIKTIGLSFESEENHDGKMATIFGYYDANGSLMVNQSKGLIRLKPYWDGKINIPINKNSFLLMDIPTLYDCNSGCPLFLNDNVIGLVSAGNSDYIFFRLVSANHILTVLSDLNIFVI